MAGKTTAKAGAAKAKGKGAAAGAAPKAKDGVAKAAPARETSSFPPIVGSEKAFLRFQGAAAAIDARDILTYRTEATLIFHNVSDGLDSLRAAKTRIARELPAVELDLLEELPDLALGLDYAVRQVTGGTANADLPGLLREASELRDPMLSGAVALAKAKLLPGAEVERIARGTGARDRANDCIDLSTLYRKSWKAIQNKTAITHEQVERAAVVGTALLKILKPKGARRRKTTEQLAPAEQRDRLFTVIHQRHGLMRRIGVWLWGEAAVDDYVPALGSRNRPRRRKAGDTNGAAAPGKRARPARTETPDG